MTLSSRDFRVLKEIAGPFHKGNHGRFLAEAMQALRGSDDPVAALELLAALHGTAYASRPNEREALDAVGSGLVTLLSRNPAAGPDRLLLEAGWLRRLAESKDPPERPAGGSGPGPARVQGPRRPAGGQQDRWRSPETFAELRRRRERALQAPVAEERVSRAAPEEARPAAPAVLPMEFEAELADVSRAREVRRKHTDRQRRGKPLKEARLDLRPVDRTLAQLARGLHAVTLRTRGFEKLFEALRDSGPGNVRMRVRVRMERGEPFAEEVEVVGAG